jgi:hypothetical protein
MLSDKDMYDRMRNGWRMGKPDGTICGAGSTMGNTAFIRNWLPDVCSQYGIKSVCDAGAGDLHWIKHVDWNVEYAPFDLIPRKPEVQEIDITQAAMPKCDAILCRMVLNHLDDERIEMALDLFRQSARYLIATQFVLGGETHFTRLDLTKWLGEPLAMSRDGHEPNCRLAIWELRDDNRLVHEHQ